MSVMTFHLDDFVIDGKTALGTMVECQSDNADKDIFQQILHILNLCKHNTNNPNLNRKNYNYNLDFLVIFAVLNKRQ